MAETALDQLSLDRVIWVPTYRPSHKFTRTVLNFDQRLEMVKRAIDSHPHFICSEVESQLPHPTFAIHTFLALQANYPGSQWYWIIGLDAFQSLPRWYRHQELISQCCWLVAPRLKSADHLLSKQVSLSASSALLCQKVHEKLTSESLEFNWYMLDMPLVEISSSLVRHYCHDGRSIRYLVPEPVRTYIAQHNLYKESQFI